MSVLKGEKDIEKSVSGQSERVNKGYLERKRERKKERMQKVIFSIETKYRNS